VTSFQTSFQIENTGAITAADPAMTRMEFCAGISGNFSTKHFSARIRAPDRMKMPRCAVNPDDFLMKQSGVGGCALKNACYGGFNSRAHTLWGFWGRELIRTAGQ
jgi:hypothetical protein